MNGDLCYRAVNSPVDNTLTLTLLSESLIHSLNLHRLPDRTRFVSEWETRLYCAFPVHYRLLVQSEDVVALLFISHYSVGTLWEVTECVGFGHIYPLAQHLILEGRERGT